MRKPLLLLKKVLLYSRPTDTTDDEINQLAQQFQSSNLNKIQYLKPNPTSLTKNWYSKPTPVDLQFEETNINNQFSVSAKRLYEWNIDGLSEDQILQKLNHLSMVANSYLSNYPDYNQLEIVSLITSGFTGMLKSWLEKNLNEDQRESILHTNQKDENNLPIFDETIGYYKPDGINT